LAIDLKTDRASVGSGIERSSGTTLSEVTSDRSFSMKCELSELIARNLQQPEWGLFPLERRARTLEREALRVRSFRVCREGKSVKEQSSMLQLPVATPMDVNEVRIEKNWLKENEIDV
jgi:hypothetical protein